VGCSEETIADGQGEETREEKRSQEEVSFRRVKTSQAKLRFKKKDKPSCSYTPLSSQHPLQCLKIKSGQFCQFLKKLEKINKIR
jgi:hypothetical protein